VLVDLVSGTAVDDLSAAVFSASVAGSSSLDRLVSAHAALVLGLSATSGLLGDFLLKGLVVKAALISSNACLALGDSRLCG
jgi:hypothetical protein